MKGDFTRMTFRQPRHYHGVRWQQGRVQNEADDNEQVDIVNHRIETETLDAVGASGVPAVGGGFAIGVSGDGAELMISAGRMYVGGHLCQLDADGVTLKTQPDLPLTAGHEVELGETPGRYLVYAHAWVRHVTALEDPYLREKALGGPDTCTRTQTVCQVKLLPLADKVAPEIECATFGLQTLPELTGTGRLKAGVAEPGVEDTPCLLALKAGYRRLENQLYRVEIHKGGVAKEATFKWSRDNGTVVFPVDHRDGKTLTLRDLGPDATRSVDQRHIVELVDDALVLQGRTTPMIEVASVDPAASTITVVDAPPVGLGADPALHPLVRRWDHGDQTTASLVEGAIPVVEGESIALEGGLEIQFEPASEDEPARTYRPGEYWLIPARTVTGDVEWPRDGSSPAFVAPYGQEPRVAALAVVEYVAAEGGTPAHWTVLHDCRKSFVAQADQVEIDGIGGDGQIVLHEGIAGLLLPQPLQVRVRRGGRAWAGARVRFRVIEGEGSLTAASADFKTVDDGVPGLTLVTDTNGVAACRWTLGAIKPSQRVQAYLLRAHDDEAGFDEVEPPIAFSASYVEAIAGRCAVELSPAMDWKKLLEEIDAAEHVADVAVCFAPGRYQLERGQRIAIHGKRSVELRGAGMGTVIASGGAESVLGLYDCEYVTVRGLFVDGLAGEPEKNSEQSIAGVLEIQGSFQVEVHGVASRTAPGATPRLACLMIEGKTPKDPLPGVCEVRVRGCNLIPSDDQIGLRVASCSRVTIEDNVVGHAPNQDGVAAALPFSMKLADDAYATEVLELALRDLAVLEADQPADGRMTFDLAGGVKLGVRPHPELADQVKAWLGKSLRGMGDRTPAEVIAEVRRQGMTELRKGEAARALGKIMREMVSATSASPIARTGILIVGEESGAITDVSKPRSGAGSLAHLPESSATALTGAGLEGAPRRESGRESLANGFELVTSEVGGASPQPRMGGTSTLDDLSAPPDYQTPGTMFNPRSRAELRVVNNTVTHVRRGIVAEPSVDTDRLGTVDICGNVVWVTIAIDGAVKGHVGISVTSMESLVVSRNRVQVDRPAPTKTDGAEMRAVGVQVLGTIGPRLVVTENLMVADQREGEGKVRDVGIEVGSGKESKPGGGLWRVEEDENGFSGEWDRVVAWGVGV